MSQCCLTGLQWMLIHLGEKKLPFFAGIIFKCIFLHENFKIANKISLKYVP